MISFLLTAIKIVFLLGFLIFIHEGGHFLVAKLCKVRVNEFAIGFGPTIWKKQGKETKYALRLIPLGGFVNMLGEEERSEEEGSFSKARIPKRIAIVAAGGLVNIIFGVIVYFILVSSTGGYVSTTVDYAMEDSAAEQVGIQNNDKIIEINNQKIRLKSDIESILAETKGEEITVTVERNGELLDLNVKPTEVITKSIGIYLGTQDENLSSEIKSLYPDSPAEKVGLKSGDIITSIDGTDTNQDANKVVELISNNTNEKIKVTVNRNGEILDFNIDPTESKAYYLGVIFLEAENNFSNNVYYGFWDTVDFSLSIVDNLKQLFTGGVSVDQFMGPVGISTVVADTQSVYEFVYLLALISLSLGVTNLLPFPPLDGGKIVILLIEAIRRKPLKENIEAGIQVAGFMLIIGLSLYITYNDILRIF